MEFQILDVDYILVNQKPVVRIFGKTIEGKTVCVFYEGFRPYFYARGDVGEVAKETDNVVGVETVKKRVVGEETPVDVIKVTCSNPAGTPEVRDKLTASGATAYEADILFKYRVMNDIGLNGMEWARVEETEDANTSVVEADIKVKAKKIVPVIKNENAPLKTLAFDIECTSSTGGLPEPNKDPIIMISLVFSEPFKGKESLVLSPRAGSDVTSYSDEKSMLEGFVEIVNHFDPDIITGYNCNNFDIPYVVERMRKLGIRPMFGRCRQKPAVSRKIGQDYRNTIIGRIVADSFALVKKDFSLQRYSLDFVARCLLGEKKEDVKHTQIEAFWMGGQNDFMKLVSYCRTDSVLAMNLLHKLDLMEKYKALSRISGTLLQDALNGGETIRIENYLLREFNKRGYIMPCKPDASVVASRNRGGRDELGGGAVLEPTKGLHKSVMVLDFKSMYPSIVRSYNICPTTKARNGTDENSVKTPTGARFLKKEIKQGIVPEILERLMNERGSIKKQMKETKGDVKRLLDAKQWALKIMANAFYGYFGYTRSRLFDLDVANSITSIGRETIVNTKKMVEEKYGLEVVYGDTDSVFVKANTDDMDEIEKIGTEISEYVTSQLPGVMELEFEKIFKRFLPLTKKRYAAWKFVKGKNGWEEGIDMKGIETVRRDWCGLVGTTMKKIIDILLKEDDIKGAVEYFKDTVGRLNRNEIPIDKLVITKTMTKSPEKYAGVQPHIELVKKLAERNPADAPGIGDRIGYVIVKGMDMLSKRTEDPEYVKEKGLPIDSGYYIDNQLLPPVERIFGALGIEKSELLGNGKQIKLMDAIMGGKNSAGQQGPLEEVKLEEVNGFICKDCSKFYKRVPLLGACSCGGDIIFSTSRGPAKSATA